MTTHEPTFGVSSYHIISRTSKNTQLSTHDASASVTQLIYEQWGFIHTYIHT